MKKIIALAIALNATTAFAFFDEGNTNGSFVNNGGADVIGNATGEGEATFGMTFEGTGNTKGELAGNGMSNAAANARGDDAKDTATGNGVFDLANNGRGNGEAAGTAKFSMNFAARANGKGDFKGNGNVDTNNNVYGYSTPYYYNAPVAK